MSMNVIKKLYGAPRFGVFLAKSASTFWNVPTYSYSHYLRYYINHKFIVVYAGITLIHRYILYKFLISFNEQIPQFVLFIFNSILIFLLTFCDNEIDSQGNGETSELSVIVETAHA